MRKTPHVLGPQLHTSSCGVLIPEVPPVENNHWIKPKGGFWTSSYIDGASDWVEWCREEGFGSVEDKIWHVLNPDPAARLFVVDSEKDVNLLYWKFSKPSRPICFGLDFEQLAREYDGVHLTEKGQRVTRYSEPGMYGWDCESTLWFRWCFTGVTVVQTVVKSPSNSEETPCQS